MPNSTISAPASFSTLPWELRRKIWEETLTPRTLTVMPHADTISTHFSHPVSCLGIGHPYLIRICCIVFTVVEGFQPNLAVRPYWTQYPFQNLIDQKLGEAQEKVGKIRKNPEYGPAVLKGPIALYVCRESREVALRRYELAFGGSNMFRESERFSELFNESNLGDKRVWVDFKRDTIFVLDAAVLMEDVANLSGTPFTRFTLEAVAYYVPEESKKIERLVLDGDWPYDIVQESWLRECLRTNLKRFVRLKELFLYQTRREGMQKITAEQLEIEDLSIDAASMADSLDERLRGEIVEDLMQAKDDDKSWTHALPEVKILRKV